MIVKLSIGTVEVIEKLTWGQQERIREAMMGGIKVHGLTDKEKQSLDLDAAVLSKAKYKTLELCVKKITLNDGTEVSYSADWMDNLSIEDGDTLFEAVNEATTSKKK